MTPLAQVPAAQFRRGLVTTGLLLVVAVLFTAMVTQVLLAAFLGVVIAVYLRPVYCRLAAALGHKAPAALGTLALLFVPVLAALAYGYLELRRAAAYVSENTADIAAELQAAVASLPGSLDVEAQARALLGRAAEAATGVPDGLENSIGGLSVAASVFLFTAFYVLTDAESIVAYLRDKVPPRYAGLTERLERHARGVLYGAVFATVVTQSIKGVWILLLMLAFGVPAPFTLALLAFAIGFFPVVGSWTVYLPAAGYVLIFDDAPLKALGLVVVAFTVSSAVSFYLRPKLAADRSEVLNFYWMFIGLIAGVYTFGIPGLVLGPLLVGLLKALVDVLTDDDAWTTHDDAESEHHATVLTEEHLHGAEPLPDPTGAGSGPDDDAEPDGDEPEAADTLHVDTLEADTLRVDHLDPKP